jgi:beta-glucosidase-like glycosyl hydrolase
MPEHAGRVEQRGFNGYGRASRSPSACLLASTQRPDLAIQEGRVLAFGALSEKRLAMFAVSCLGMVAVVLFRFWLALRLAD